MEKSTSSLFERAFSPFYQALITYGGVIVVIAGSAIVKSTGLLSVPDRFPWLTAAAFLLLFALFNSVFALNSKHMGKYFGKSIYSFLGLALVTGLTAYVTSSISINDAGSYRWIYIVVTIGYMVFLSMVMMMKTIVEFAQREEWNQPRIRQKLRKSDRDRHIK